jgi:hypothetical protein
MQLLDDVDRGRRNVLDLFDDGSAALVVEDDYAYGRPLRGSEAHRDSSNAHVSNVSPRL